MPVDKSRLVKTSREIMEILAAYDLTGSYRVAAELVGCDHHTVAQYVQLREARQSPVAREHRARPIEEYLEKIEELVVRSGGRVRADVVHRRITAMGFTGGERTTRRVVSQAKKRFRVGQRRVFRPWITEPGLWTGVGLGRGPADQGPAHEPVVCVAGVVTVPGGDPGVGQDNAHHRVLFGHDAAAGRWVPT